MNKKLLHRLRSLVQEFYCEHLTGEYDAMTIKSIDNCTEEESVLHCSMAVSERYAGQTKFKAVLELRYPNEVVLEYKDSEIGDWFDGPRELTLLMTCDEIYATLWQGFDIC